MKKHVFVDKEIDFLKQPMFFGEEGVNVQRYDEQKYPFFEKQTAKMVSFFWRPEEVDLLKDRADYQKLTEHEKFIFTSNLKYQILLDSVQGRAPGLAFLPFVTLPELEEAIVTWQFFEVIHSRSYSHMIRNLYSVPKEVFMEILPNEHIVKRANSVTKAYDDFIEYGIRWRAGLETDKYELRKKLYLALISVNILEGIRFYVSFACTFAFGENKLMEGSAKIISLIARDEKLHLSITQNMINYYRRKDEDPLMTQVIEDCVDIASDMYREAAEEEKEWARYLFKDGSMIGLNDKLLDVYVDYLTNQRMKNIGLKPAFKNVDNPLSWMDHWLNSKGVQVAPQETEIEAYLVGSFKHDVDDETFEGFSLD
jgi:ribonucleotide reductase beta subunit family protein with ferritin-like domain